MPITAPSRGSSSRSRSRRAFRRRSPRVVPLPLPLLIRTSSLAAFGTPSPYYRTRRTFLYQSHHRRTTAPSALSYYYDHGPVSGSMLNRGGWHVTASLFSHCLTSLT